MKFITSICCITLLLSLSVFAQKEISFHLSTEDLLPFEKIYALQATSSGHLALGTENGVYSFDGLEFRKLQIPVEDEIIWLSLNSDSSVYAVSLGNVIYEVTQDSLKKVIDWSDRTKGYLRYVKQGNRLFLSSSNGLLFHYDLSTKKLDSSKISSYTINPLQIYQDNLYFHTVLNGKQTLSIYNTDQHLVIRSREIEFNLEQFDLFGLSGKKYLIGNYQKQKQSRLFELTQDNNLKETFKFQNFKFKNRYRTVSYPNCVLLLSSNGLEVLNETLSLSKEILKGKTVTGAHLDKRSLWVSTLSSGLFYFPDYKAQLIDKSNSILTINDLNQATTFKHYLLFTNLYGELFALEPDKTLKKLTNSKAKKETNYGFKLHTNPDTIFFQSKDSSYKITQVGGKLSMIRSEATSGSKDRSLWNSIEVYSSIQGAFIKNDINPSTKTERILSNSFVRKNENEFGRIQLTNARSEKNSINPVDTSILVATDRHLLRFKNHKFDTLTLRGESIRAEQLEQRGALTYFSTKYFIAVILPHQKEPHLIFESAEAEINSFSITEEHLIVCTKKGVHIFDKYYQRLALLNTTNGLPSNNISGATLLEKKLYTTSKKGLGILPIDSLKILSLSKDLEITIEEVTVNGEKVDLSNLPLQLSYLENDLKFSLKGLDLKSFENRKYWYQLIGAKNNWQLTTSPKSIRFPNLKSGEYVFSAYLESNNGIRSDPISIPFTISLPLWKRTWFLLSIFFLSLLFLFFYFRTRIRRVKRNKELANKLIQSEIDGLKSQMNPHFIFNSLNSIQDLIISEDIANSNLYLGKFAKLLRLVLNYSSQAKIKIYEEVNLLETYLELESLRFKRQLSAQVKVDSSEGIENFLIPSLIIQPYVENSIKHGLLHSQKTEKKIVIIFTKEQDHVVCSIEDNGIGRVASASINQRREKYHKPFATKAIQKRIDLINETLECKIKIKIIDSTEGTRVELYFPITD